MDPSLAGVPTQLQVGEVWQSASLLASSRCPGVCLLAVSLRQQPHTPPHVTRGLCKLACCKAFVALYSSRTALRLAEVHPICRLVQQQDSTSARRSASFSSRTAHRLAEVHPSLASLLKEQMPIAIGFWCECLEETLHHRANTLGLCCQMILLVSVIVFVV